MLRTSAARVRLNPLALAPLGLALSLLLALGLPAALHATTPDDPAVASAIPFYDLEEQRAVDAVNAARRSRGLDPLVFSPILTEAAQWMANDLRTRDLSHTDTLGRDIRARLNHFGYPAIAAISENVARGFRTGEQVVASWMASSGHRTNILNPDSVAYGLARAKRPGGPSDWAWALVFGSVADADAGRVPSSRPLTVPLARGWNLVSWSGDWATSDVLRVTLPASVTSVTTWDLRAGRWFGLLPYVGISDIALIGPGQPLWVWSESPVSWDQPLKPALGREIELLPGWQLVSWQGADATPLTQAIAAILPRVRSAARFQAQDQLYDLFIPGSPLVSFTTVDRGDAFWLLIDAPTTWRSGG